MKSYVFTIVWGVVIWFIATMFFILFGEHVLFSPGTEKFMISFLLLQVGTAILLWAVTRLYLLFDQSINAAIKFGVIGTIIGLSLDTLSISYHEFFFPKLDEGQIIAFTAWMSLAYALYLLIPTIINSRVIKRHNKNCDSQIK